jgi:hypothetical protein
MWHHSTCVTKFNTVNNFFLSLLFFTVKNHIPSTLALKLIFRNQIFFMIGGEKNNTDKNNK